MVADCCGAGGLGLEFLTWNPGSKFIQARVGMVSRKADRQAHSGSLGSQLDWKWSVAGGEWGVLMGRWVPVQPLHPPRTEQWLERLIGSSQYVFRA